MTDGKAGLWSCSPLSVVLWFFYLFADGGENFSNRGETKMIGDEFRDEATHVAVGRISRAGSVRRDWLEQPGSLALLDSDNARLLRRRRFTGGFPAVGIDESGGGWLGIYVSAHNQIPLAANLWR